MWFLDLLEKEVGQRKPAHWGQIPGWGRRAKFGFKGLGQPRISKPFLPLPQRQVARDRGGELPAT